MQSLIAGNAFLLREFAPLVAFRLVSATFGVKSAVAVSIAVVACEVARRLIARIPFTKLNLVVSALSAAPGSQDANIGPTGPAALPQQST